MRIFLTGATGFIGSRIVPELLAAGHHVLGMTRSDDGARALIAAGVEVHRGQLEDLDSLRSGAAMADAVIHTAFDHDFSNFVANCEKDRQAIKAMGSALVGSNRPLLITSGTGMGSSMPGKPATEDVVNMEHPNPRTASEIAGNEMLAAGVAVSVMRLPQVHDTVKQGLVSPLIEVARAKGVSAYIGEGLNRWPAAHVLDVARLYRLAIENASRVRATTLSPKRVFKPAILRRSSALGWGAGEVHLPERGRRSFWMAWRIRRPGSFGVERVDP
jgi:nucleoside-diphosphate-sugar epimerase